MCSKNKTEPVIFNKPIIIKIPIPVTYSLYKTLVSHFYSNFTIIIMEHMFITECGEVNEFLPTLFGH